MSIICDHHGESHLVMISIVNLYMYTASAVHISEEVHQYMLTKTHVPSSKVAIFILLNPLCINQSSLSKMYRCITVYTYI